MENEEETKAIITAFYKRLGKKESVIDLFADEVDWQMRGNSELFPWVGNRKTKVEVADFFDAFPKNVEPLTFDVDFIAVNGDKGVASGKLSSKIIKYDKIFNSYFATIFKIADKKIIQYLFLEDSNGLVELSK